MGFPNKYVLHWRSRCSSLSVCLSLSLSLYRSPYTAGEQHQSVVSRFSAEELLNLEKQILSVGHPPSFIRDVEHFLLFDVVCMSIFYLCLRNTRTYLLVLLYLLSNNQGWARNVTRDRDETKAFK